jgi:drug/metabolite transporter (DMT)-like permease
MVITALLMGHSFPSSGEGIELWGSLLYLIFIGSILGYSAYVFVLNNLPPSLASVYAYINPIVAVLLGWLILKEHINWITVISSLVTLTGVYIVKLAVNRNKQVA